MNLLITGSAGFLGGRAAKYFASFPDKYMVVATSRRNTRKQELEKNNCVFIEGDLLNKEHCNSITKNIDVVIHCAALSSTWGNYTEFYYANVLSTQNLMEAAIANNVKKFIFISTPNIYFNYRNRFAVKETDALPKKFVSHYASTKLAAEQWVLKQNNQGIQTIALRPRAIIGAEDTVIFPRLLQAYYSGKLKIIGNGKTTSDLTCVRNVIAAIECAIHAKDNATGYTYNISNGEQIVLWNTINKLFGELGLMPVTKKIPAWLALSVASFIEKKHRLLQKQGEPPITKYGMATLAVSMTVDISFAEQLLNYKPVQTTEEGIKEFLLWYKQNNKS